MVRHCRDEFGFGAGIGVARKRKIIACDRQADRNRRSDPAHAACH
jgi:hypothetical protein